MELDEIRAKLRGIYTIVVTPMEADFRVDLKRLYEHTRFLVEGGIREGTGVLVPVGAGGEGYHLTVEENLDAVRTVIEAAKGEVPVFPGCTLPSTLAACDLCRRYQELGAAGVQLSPPYYYEPSEQEYVNHYRRCAEAAPQLGIVVYNSYWNSGFDASSGTLAKLVDIPNIVGVKWSSSSLENYQRALRDHSERLSFIDNQLAWSAVLGRMLGANGHVTSVPNFAPAYELTLWELLRNKEWEKALKHMRSFLVPLYEYRSALRRSGVHGEGPFWKACCELMGRPMGASRPPHRSFSSDELEGLRDVFVQGGLL